MLKLTFDAVARVSPSFRRFLMRSWYETLVMLDRERDITFMNYGYAGLDPDASEITLNDREQVNRYCIQLYHHVVAAIDLSGKDVVEVGSGRGGGAFHITRYLKPRSMVGIDFSRKAIEFCRKYYSIDGLSFTQGDAENLPLGDGSVDAVINLESFKDSGLRVVRENDITLNVVRALELDNDRKERLIAQKCPKILKRATQEFAAVKGTRTYETFKSGHSRYLSFVLHKEQRAIT